MAEPIIVSPVHALPPPRTDLLSPAVEDTIRDADRELERQHNEQRRTLRLLLVALGAWAGAALTAATIILLGR